jgi:hypothetical protein
MELRPGMTATARDSDGPARHDCRGVPRATVQPSNRLGSDHVNVIILDELQHQETGFVDKCPKVCPFGVQVTQTIREP